MYAERGNAVAGGINKASNGPASNCVDTAETAINNFINRLDLIYNNIRESLDIQGGVLSRLYGPSPTSDGCTTSSEKEPYPCAIACVAQRIDSLSRLAEELYGNSIRFNKLA